MEENKKAAIEKIYLLTKQDAEFDEELRKKLEITSSASSAIIDDERLNHIYEYCIEEIIRKQAEEFYKDFPIASIIPTLIEDYVRMESFHRKDNFGDFCLALYQQIENISNKICESSGLAEITDKMWGHLAYVKAPEGQQEPDFKDRTGKTDIANLIFYGTSKSGLPNAVEKSKKTLQNQFASDKICASTATSGVQLNYNGTVMQSDLIVRVEALDSTGYNVYYVQDALNKERCGIMDNTGKRLTEPIYRRVEKLSPELFKCFFLDGTTMEVLHFPAIEKKQ